MTSNTDFTGAVILLTDTAQASELADTIAQNYFPDSKDYHFTLSESTPSSLPVDLFDQIEANRLEVPGSTVMTVYPFALSDTILSERPTNGKIPS